MEGRPAPEGIGFVVAVVLAAIGGTAGFCGGLALFYLWFVVFVEREVLALGDAALPESVHVERNPRAESRWNWPARALMRRLRVRVMKAEAIFTVEGRQQTARNSLVVPDDWRAGDIAPEMVRVWYRPARPGRNWLAAVAQGEGDEERPVSFPLQGSVR
jgi:hypothetical protein